MMQLEEGGNVGQLEYEYYTPQQGNEGVDAGSAAAASEEAEGESVR